MSAMLSICCPQLLCVWTRPSAFILLLSVCNTCIVSYQSTELKSGVGDDSRGGGLGTKPHTLSRDSDPLWLLLSLVPSWSSAPVYLL